MARYKIVPIGRAKDISGNKYGRLTTITRVEPPKHIKYKRVHWLCKCDCGNELVVSADSLTTGHTQSCGCLFVDEVGKKNAIDLIGKRFGRLTVVAKTDKRQGRSIIWECQCDCGNNTEVPSSNLITNHTRSCGCLNEEVATKRIIEVAKSNVGDKHPNFNPTLSDEERLNNRYQLNGQNLRDWRVKVYERDNYTCQTCGLKEEVSGNLNAHHLDGWHWCKERRFDIDNGITLCVDCHKSFHREYGRGNNTREQFEEFAQMEVAK